jgi:GNAT superfamily N-acetyltransferase
MTCGTITIRKSRLADLARADALFAESYAALLKDNYPPSVKVLAVPLLSRARPDLLASGTYYVAEDPDGRLVAAGGWTRSARHGGIGQVRHVVTDCRRIRQGIGTALMMHIIDAARTAGVRHLQCRSSRTAVPFYASFGFRELGAIEVPLAPGIAFPAVAMERGLGATPTGPV